MSTFDGIIHEFPDIRIDYFRPHPNRRQPTACFLSHIHSDHLLGLESLKMPFVYCSAATRRILLKMEKYPHRINFSKGILEARKQTYKHLKLLLRPLPLETAIKIELSPGHHIRVTLFDANHCPGGVMFLIEDSNRAVLYTGDIRAEPWWVNALLRSPSMMPYTAGIKQLDCLYLDTTFASHADIYKHFPTKAEGLAELLGKVSNCPQDAIFYFRAWTMGYEDVWKLLSNTLNSPVHVDQYQIRLFTAVAGDGLNNDATSLVGFVLGNTNHPGCLTTSQHARIHSCEPGLPCHVALKRAKSVVWISPIVSRLEDGTEVAEVGAGGGGGDLYQSPELENNKKMIESLRTLCAQLATDGDTAARLQQTLADLKSPLQLNDLGFDADAEITIRQFVQSLAKHDKRQGEVKQYMHEHADVIRFPYSRHSSYTELRHLVDQLKPADICPCTVDLEVWNESLSMASLFGDLCSDNVFRYDKRIREQAASRHHSTSTETASQLDSQRTQTASQRSIEHIDAMNNGTASQAEIQSLLHNDTARIGQKRKHEQTFAQGRQAHKPREDVAQPHPQSSRTMHPSRHPGSRHHQMSSDNDEAETRPRSAHDALQEAIQTQDSATSDPSAPNAFNRSPLTASQNLDIRKDFQRQWRELMADRSTYEDEGVSQSSEYQPNSPPQIPNQPQLSEPPQNQQEIIHTPHQQIMQVFQESDSFADRVRAQFQDSMSQDAEGINLPVNAMKDNGPQASLNLQATDRQSTTSEVLVYGIQASERRIHEQMFGKDYYRDKDGNLPPGWEAWNVDSISKEDFMARPHRAADWVDIEEMNERQAEAYDAARRCLEVGDDREWKAMNIWSSGYTGHTEREVEL